MTTLKSVDFSSVLNGHLVDVNFEVQIFDTAFDEEFYTLSPGQVVAFVSVDGVKLAGAWELQCESGAILDARYFSLGIYHGTSDPVDLMESVNPGSDDDVIIQEDFDAFVKKMCFKAGVLLEIELEAQIEENGAAPDVAWVGQLS